MAELFLKTGEPVLVDDADLPLVQSKKWYRHSGGYATAYLSVSCRGAADGRLVLMHELITGLKFVDHENGNRLDNRRSNLRPANKFQNARNASVRTCATKTSRFKGVCWHAQREKWYARIAGKSLGLFPTEESAALAYNIAAKELFGEFARFNII